MPVGVVNSEQRRHQHTAMITRPATVIIDVPSSSSTARYSKVANFHAKKVGELLSILRNFDELIRETSDKTLA